MAIPTRKTKALPRFTLALTAAAALSATTAASGTARAAEPGPDTLPINVISIQTNDADDQAEALTKALRGAVRATQGWSLGEGDYSLEVLSLSLKCPDPPDANCQSRIADQIKSDRYVWGTLKKPKGKQIVQGQLHLWVRGKGTSVIPLEYASNLTDQNDDALKRIAADAIANLTGGPPKGGIHVKAGNVGGQVFVDGQPVGALKDGDGTFSAPAGSHKVTVKAVGYADAESTIVVKAAGDATNVTLTMVPKEGPSNINWKRVGGIAALGGGVVFGIVGAVSAGQVNSVNSQAADLRKSKNVTDPCVDATAKALNFTDTCNKGKTFQTLQIVMFPLAAVAGGLGIYMIATSGRSEPAPVKTGFVFDPQIGPQGGKLDLTYTF